MDYAAYLKQPQLPHRPIIAGMAFLLFGVFGIVMRRGPEKDQQ